MKQASLTGIQKNSKWRVAWMRSSSRAMHSSGASNQVCSCSRNAGTNFSRTCDTTPSAPSETRAARIASPSRSRSNSRTMPPAVTIRRPTAWLEMLCTVRPVPWVPVAIAPAIAWRSMSPMVVIAQPAARSGSPSSKMREPAHTVASPAAASTATTPARFSSDTRVPPEASQSGTKEWPLPATRTVSPRRELSATAAASSSSLRGRTIRRGVDVIAPDQLVQLSEAGSEAVSTTRDSLW